MGKKQMTKMVGIWEKKAPKKKPRLLKARLRKIAACTHLVFSCRHPVMLFVSLTGSKTLKRPATAMKAKAQPKGCKGKNSEVAVENENAPKNAALTGQKEESETVEKSDENSVKEKSEEPKVKQPAKTAKDPSLFLGLFRSHF